MAESKRVVVITGAAHGIGKGISEWLANGDWQVVALDRDEEALATLRKHRDITTVTTDVTVPEDIRKAIDFTTGEFGRLDAIVSNAGISEFKSLADCSLDDWNRILATNLTPAFLFAKWAEQPLRASRGAMVLISSTRAHMSEPDTHGYSATKGGLSALTHSLAISMGPDVRVNCISPGWIDVSGEVLSPEDHAQHPAGRVGTPDDIAAAVGFLLAPEARFVTGAELVVDGGMTRKMIYR